jgi:hypothetical protein
VRNVRSFWTTLTCDCRNVRMETTSQPVPTVPFIAQARPKGASQGDHALRRTTDVAAASIARHCSPAGRIAHSHTSAGAPARQKNSIPQELNAEVAQEVRQQFFGCLFQLQSDPEAMQVGHLQLGVATRVDALKRLKININIESHSMEARAAPDA